MTELALSVTELARFCHRRGDIDHRFTPSPTGPEGIAGHQRLYARRPDSYRSEYPVELEHAAHGVRLRLRGRADGYDVASDLIEEIKTCRVAPSSIPDEISELHMAQGKLYAAVIARENNLRAAQVRLTWFNIDTEEEYSRDETHSAAELLAFLDQALDTFCRWVVRVQACRVRRDASARILEFPFGAFREGQRSVAELTYKCVDQGGQLMLEAPTGIGKTAAVLFPAIKALATGKHDKVIFVTARTVGRLAAEDALQRFRKNGFIGSAMTLTAKERICLAPGQACHGDDCPYARNYYNKLPAAMEEALQADNLSREDIERIAHAHQVCPYELTLDMLPWADLIIADIHYVYSLQRLLAGQLREGGSRWSVLLDEAHNLPDRARDMYSASLHKSDVLRCKREAPSAVSRALDRINRRMLALARLDWQEPDFHSTNAADKPLLRALADFTAVVGAGMAQDHRLLVGQPQLRTLYFDVLQFLRVEEEWGEDFRFQLHRESTGRTTGASAGKSLRVTLNCLDPARLLSQRQRAAHSVTAFSATLSPLYWARRNLGLKEDAVCLRAPSPFKPEQLTVSLSTGIDTRFRQRERTLPDLATALSRWLLDTPGNCLLYFPSYRYLNDCLDLLTFPEADRTLWRQQPEQSDAERDELLRLLRERRDVAAFCILGGVWGEGIDLPGDQLSSVVVVGVGMPQINRETRELQAHYQRTHGNGFDFAFLYPGMQKVAQAIGRVVRRDSDQGSALLIDPRYGETDYRELLPPWWTYREVTDQGFPTAGLTSSPTVNKFERQGHSPRRKNA